MIGKLDSLNPGSTFNSFLSQRKKSCHGSVAGVTRFSCQNFLQSLKTGLILPVLGGSDLKRPNISLIIFLCFWP